jgi:hypothetical protein
MYQQPARRPEATLGIVTRSGRRGPNDPSRKNPYAPPPEATVHHVLVDEEGSEGDAPRQRANRPAKRLLGLRVDIGTRKGMEARLATLTQILARTGSKGSFFVALGPDRTGLAALPYLREPSLLRKGWRLLKSSPLGMSDLLTGTLMPSRPARAEEMRGFADLESSGHEVGSLGWDSWGWRSKIPRYGDAENFSVLDQTRGMEAFRALFGREPSACASPGFVCTEELLRERDAEGLTYASDGRGSDPFLPVVGGRVTKTPQVPVSLPTSTELFLSECPSTESCYNKILNALKEESWPVYRASLEWEGGAFAEAFGQFLEAVRGSGVDVVTLGSFLESRLALGPLPKCTLSYGAVDGRPGEVTFQMLDV